MKKTVILAIIAACVCLSLPAFADDAPPQPYHSPYLHNTTSLETTDKSKGTPTKFVVPEKYAADVWAEAQSLISEWKDREPIVRVMKIQLVNDNIIQTYNPPDSDKNIFIAFNLSSVKKDDGREISISTSHNFFLPSTPKDAAKRGMLLSFLLQEYLKEIETAPADATKKPEAKSKLAPEIDAMLNSIRTLLEANQTEAALAEMDTLKTLLQKQKPEETKKP